MQRVRQLSLVGNEATSAHEAPATAVERVFQHWVWMLGKNPRRCALGPQRRRVIERALDLYDEDTLLLAIEGCASDPFNSGHNDRDTEYNDLELILRNEANVERFAAKGERVRMKAQQARQRELQAAAAAPEQAADPAEAQRLRERLRATAAELARRSLPNA